MYLRMEEKKIIKMSTNLGLFHGYKTMFFFAGDIFRKCEKMCNFGESQKTKIVYTKL